MVPCWGRNHGGPALCSALDSIYTCGPMHYVFPFLLQPLCLFLFTALPLNNTKGYILKEETLGCLTHVDAMLEKGLV